MYSGKLIGAALPGLAVIWRDGYRYKKAGVAASACSRRTCGRSRPCRLQPGAGEVGVLGPLSCPRRAAGVAVA